VFFVFCEATKLVNLHFSYMSKLPIFIQNFAVRARRHLVYLRYILSHEVFIVDRLFYQ